MDEAKIFSIELDGLFPELDEPPKMHGTAAEILERIADQWGLEEEDPDELDVVLDVVYPSTRAYRAQQLLEERLQNSKGIVDPDGLINALIKEGLVRPMTEAELELFQDEFEMDEFEEARVELDEEWQDGLWEN